MSLIERKIGMGKRKPGRPRKVGRPKKGAGLWDDIKGAASSAHNWLKSNKVVSRVAGAIGNVWAPAKAIATAADSLGYGKKKGGAFDFKGALSGVNKFLRDKKIVSSALRSLGHPKLAAASASLGYGKPKRKKAKKAKKKGGAFNLKGALSGVNKFLREKKIVSSALKSLGHPKLAAASSALGYGGNAYSSLLKSGLQTLARATANGGKKKGGSRVVEAKYSQICQIKR